METWSDEEILQRWNKVSGEFQLAVEEATPVLKRLSKLEMEICVLKTEILKRGITTNDRENGR